MTMKEKIRQHLEYLKRREMLYHPLVRWDAYINLIDKLIKKAK